MTTISQTRTTTTTPLINSPPVPQSNPVADLTKALGDFSKVIGSAAGPQRAPAMPADGMMQSQKQTMDLSGGGSKPMDIYGAAQVLKNHFQLAEGVGTDDSGEGAGDGNIGPAELKRLAAPDSGAPPQLQQAARFILDNPTMARALDGKGDAGLLNLSMGDLDKMLAEAPKDSQSIPAADPKLASGLSSNMMSMLGSMGRPSSSPQLGASPTGDVSPTSGAPQLGASPTGDAGGGAKPMDIYGAAQTLLKHFNLAEGVGMNKSGKGSGDGNIGPAELKRLAAPDSGAPPELQKAAKFILDNPTMARALDGKGDAGSLHLNKGDLLKMVASAPKEAAPNASSSPTSLAALGQSQINSARGGSSGGASPTTGTSQSAQPNSLAALGQSQINLVKNSPVDLMKGGSAGGA